MYDLIIPIAVYGLIFYLFGLKVFKIMVIVGLVIGFFAVVWLFAEKSYDLDTPLKKAKNKLKKIGKKLLKFWDDL